MPTAGVKRDREETEEQKDQEQRERTRQVTEVTKRSYEPTLDDENEEHAGRILRDPDADEDMNANISDMASLLEEELHRTMSFDDDSVLHHYLSELCETMDEPEPFVGMAPGFDEDWRELPYKEVLAARLREMQCLRDFGTFIEVDPSTLPTGTKAIPCRFFYRKREKDVKARVVVQQIKKKYGSYRWVDIFAAAPSSTAHALFAWYALVHGWPVIEGDLTTAFLHADLEEGMPDIYVQPPTEVDQGKWWKLQKALYGLRISPRLFQRWLSGEFKSVGFQPTRPDPMLFWRESDHALIVAHADNVRITVEPEAAGDLKLQLGQRMKIRWENELGEDWSAYLGSSWKRPGPHEMRVKPEKRHFDQLFKTLALTQAKPVSTPNWSPAEERREEVPLDEQRVTDFRSGVGLLQWIAHATVRPRPDLQYTVKELARALAHPSERDWSRLRRVARYCLGSCDAEMVMKPEVAARLVVLAHGDSSYADLVDRKSTTGFAIRLQTMVVAMGARTQAVIALSPGEA